MGKMRFILLLGSLAYISREFYEEGTFGADGVRDRLRVIKDVKNEADFVYAMQRYAREHGHENVEEQFYLTPVRNNCAFLRDMFCWTDYVFFKNGGVRTVYLKDSGDHTVNLEPGCLAVSRFEFLDSPDIPEEYRMRPIPKTEL